MIINSGFSGKRDHDQSRIPPGQYLTEDFPVFSLGPTPKIDRDGWRLTVDGLAEHTVWGWEELSRLPKITIKTDIHCVTRWSKFDTAWQGVAIDELMRQTKVKPSATHLIAYSSDGYSTNLPLADVIRGQALVATVFEGAGIPPEHGGPARLLVPHLYLWKSAKWLERLEFIDHDEPGFWETRGYHNYGDPWQEQRNTYD